MMALFRFLLPKIDRIKLDFDDLYTERFWAFSGRWWEEIDKAYLEMDCDRLEFLYKSLKEASENNPQDFPLWYLKPIPREVEAAFAKRSTSKEVESLHQSLKIMPENEQAKVVKRLIRFWLKRSPDEVPSELKQWVDKQDKESLEPPASSAEPFGATTPQFVHTPVRKPLLDPNKLSILIGKSGNDSVYWEPSRETNGFLIVVGSSGSGKTETLKVLSEEISNFGIPVVIFDFHGDIDTPSASPIILSHSTIAEYGINPMELDSLDPHDGGVFAQTNILIEMLSAFIPSTGHRQVSLLKDYFKLAYKQAGITDDPETWNNPAPSFSTVIELMKDGADEARVSKNAEYANRVDGAIAIVEKIFEHPVFDKPKQISLDDLSSKSYRLILKSLEPSVAYVVVDTLLRKIGRYLMSKGNIPVNCTSDRDRYRLAVVVDEAHRFTVGGANSKGRDADNGIINISAREYRKFGEMLILGSQSLGDFGDATKAQVATKIALKMQIVKEAQNTSPDFGLSVEDLLNLKGKGDGYFKVGTGNAIRVQFTPMYKRQKN
ncbi:ATP-binding protein [Pseudanabaena sp. 'Roaring Creek']|uniref:ATP-binding protein n=1 Tax=Pseudanabaena sp. 'Roaring Creek' TaxID=1681830 RepID=UPI0009E89169|nr:ATP-binding protein [Pseudanabaena sp. 'Roaring Creek']